MPYKAGEWPRHPHEKRRLKALSRFNVLDTEFEQAFDRIAQLVKHVLHVPISAISLVDSRRQWFKSCFGLDVRETGRDVCFSAHAIMPDAPEVFVVNDATQDERFSNDPMVTGNPHLRFYASVPLVHDGMKVGTLFGCDHSPRGGLSENEATAMLLLADMVIELLVSRISSNLVELAHIQLAERTHELNITNQGLTELIDSANAPIFAVDSELTVTVWNRKIAEISCLEPHEVLGKPFDGILARMKTGDVSSMRSELTGLEDKDDKPLDSSGAQEVTNALEKALQGEGCGLFELEMCTFEDRGHAHLEVSASPKLNHQGEIVGVVCVGEDVLARKRVLQEELRNRQLTETNDAKDAFLASMSHEIRTPLNGLLGMLQLAIASELSASSSRFVKQAHNSGKLLLNLINDIFDVARINAEQLRLDLSPFVLAETLEETVGIIAADATGKRLRLELDIDDKLKGMWFNADATRIQQLLLNLLGNSIKFTTDGFVKLTAKILSDADSTVQVLFEVIDTGRGIDPRAHATIFQRWSPTVARRMPPETGSSPNRTQSKHVPGLGMSICKELVDLMSGTIELKSVPSIKGTTVSFMLPLAKYEQTNANAGSTLSADKGGQGLRILVVEDNDYNVDVIKEILEFLGHNVSVASNGEEGYFAVCSSWSELDLVLMDCDMPVMNGFEATRAIRKWESENGKHAGIRIVAVTAYVMSGDKQRCFDAGMDDYLTKPVLLPQLRMKLHMHMETDEQTRSRQPRTDAANPLVASLKLRDPSPALKQRDSSPAPKQQNLPSSLKQHDSSTSLKQLDPSSSSSSRATAFNRADEDPPAIDISKLVENFGGNLQLVRRTLKMFNGKVVFDEMPESLGDFHTLKSLAHKVKGQFGYMSAAAAYDLAARLEQTCKSAVEGSYSETEDANDLHHSVGALVEELKFETHRVFASVERALMELDERLDREEQHST